MITAYCAKPGHHDQLKTFHTLCTAVDEVANRDQQITSHIESDLIQLGHQKRIATMQITHYPRCASQRC
jgi:hypothetical protein